MGVNLRIVIGAGIQIPTPKKNCTMTVRKCSNNEHEVSKVFNFCCFCGEKIKEHQIEYKENVWIQDVIPSNNFTEVKLNDGKSYLFSNLKSKETGLLQIKYDSCTSIDESLINKLLCEFRETHKKDIEKLEEYLGYKVKVEFLFINYID